jgi:probable rRNA maturation factor
MRRVQIHNQTTGVRLPRRKLTQLTEMILKDERRVGEINLIFVSDAKMRAINRQYRKIDKTTDVLSFSLEDDSDHLLGEIYISLTEAARNARELKVSLTKEILRLFCHGALHLCGIHHPDLRARAIMADREEGYLMALSEKSR